MLKLSPQYSPGIPDRLLVTPAGMVLVEMKRAGGVCTPRQLLTHKKIQRAGGVVYVVDNKETFTELLSTLSK